jgi:hypothetical protein
MGQLADVAREQIEKDLLANDELFEELLVVEDEIIDEYLAEKLSPEDRKRFEHYFLSTPERFEHLNFARALNRYVSASGKPEPAPVGFLAFISRQPVLVRAISLAVILAALGGLIWLFRSQRSSPQTFATLSLTISQGTRAEGLQVPTLKLPISEDALKIVLKLPDPSSPAARFRAELETLSGAKKDLETAAQDANSVTVIVPAADLKPGQYSIRLFAIDSDGRERRVSGSYLFRLE